MSDTSRAIGAPTLGDYKITQEWGQTLKITAVKEGDFSTLLGAMPARGDVVGTFSGVAVNCTTTKLEQLDGTGGKLTVEAESVLLQATYSAALGEPQYEIEFEELTKKIEQHPCCGTLKPGGRNWDEWQDFTDADYVKRGDTAHGGAALPSGIWATIDTGSGPAWSLDDYLAIKNLGVEDSVYYYPVVIRTLQYLAKPTDIGNNSGLRSTPPVGSFADISSYSWLQGADSCTKRGNLYERITKWTGTDLVVAIVYPPGS